MPARQPASTTKPPLFLTFIGPAVAIMTALLIMRNWSEPTFTVSSHPWVSINTPSATPTQLPNLELLWQYNMGYAEEDFIEANGTIYLISTSPCEFSTASQCSSLDAVDLETGQLKWSLPYYSDVIAARNDILLARTGSDLVSISAKSGQVQQTITNYFHPKTSPYASDQIPAIANNNVYYLDGNKLIAFDLQTRSEEWRTEYGEEIDTSPIVANGMVFIAASVSIMRPNTDVVVQETTLYAIETQYGQTRWQRKLSEDYGVVDFLRSNNGIIYVTQGYDPTRVNLIAVDGQTGEELWTFEPTNEDRFGLQSNPELVGNSIYLWTLSEVLYVLSADKGEVLTRLDDTALPPMVQHHRGVTLTHHDKHIYLKRADNTITILNPNIGGFTHIYQSKFSHEPQTAISSGEIYFFGKQGDYLSVFTLPK